MNGHGEVIEQFFAMSVGTLPASMLLVGWLIQ